MLTKIPTQTDWLNLYEAGMALFIFAMLLIVFAILFLEWSELAESVKSITKFIKPKKWNKQQNNSQ